MQSKGCRVRAAEQGLQSEGCKARAAAIIVHAIRRRSHLWRGAVRTGNDDDDDDACMIPFAYVIVIPNRQIITKTSKHRLTNCL